MNRTEARKLWVGALRSGVYKQGKYYLHEGDTYCCLGVACELYRLHKSGPDWSNEDDGGDYEDYGDDALENSYMGESEVLPRRVMNWLGLKNQCGSHGISMAQERSLSGLNDSGESFETIAAVVEAAPDGLFTTKGDQ